MATTKLVPPYEKAAAAAAAEDDYIDMDISSATLFCYTTTTTTTTTTTVAATTTAKCSPPHHSIEFEFQMSSDSLQRGEETSPSPADELFYKGKLLPLHLPPRMQMVESLAARFQRNNNVAHISGANLSAPSSCYVSGELIPREDYFGGRSSAELQKKRRWSEKLKSISQSNLGRKMKASRAYIKSLFTKSDESSAAAASVSSQPIACSSGHLKPSTLIKSIERERLADEEELLHHRKSFSGAINWHFATTTPKSSSNSMTSSSSSSSSFSSVNSGGGGSGFYGPLVLKRSSSANSEVESPIEGAIAHCKKSQQPARKSVSDVGGYTLTASKIVAAACENKERPGLCRG